MRLLIGIMLVAACAAARAEDAPAVWTSYGGAGGMRYSPLSDIKTKTVWRLEVAWTFRTGDEQLSARDKAKAAFETTPIMVDGLLFVSTPFNRVFALDART